MKGSKKAKHHFTKLELILAFSLFVVIVGIAFYFTKNTLFDKVLNLQKFPETEQEWADYMGNKLDNYCIRKVVYQLKPEFNRALSLYLQRINESPKDDKNTLLRAIRSNLKCIDINYASTSDEMTGADGLFLFSKDFSNNNRLSILVNPYYKAQDDLMTAMLLAHELVHADQFIYEDVYNITFSECNKKANFDLCNKAKQAYSYFLKSCYDKEIMAFGLQLHFYLTLKDSESNTLLSKYVTGNTANYNLPVIHLMNNYVNLMNVCTKQNDINACVRQWFENQVKSSPFYQKQCGV